MGRGSHVLGGSLEIPKSTLRILKKGDMGPGVSFQGTIGCTPNSVPMVLIGLIQGFLGIITHKHPLYRDI